MATLIAVYNSEGCVGRCDAKCYKATEPQCVCICGGMNHGVGYNKAVENTSEWVAEEAEAAGQDGVATFIRRSLKRFRAEHGQSGHLDVKFGEDGSGALQPALL